MGVVKHKNNKTKEVKKKDAKIANGKPKKEDGKVKKKKTVSCLQCIKKNDDGGQEGKYRVAAPELMQDTFMSDSEDEGGEVECPIQQQQQYRYMNSEAGTLHRAKPLEDSVTDGHLWPSNNDSKRATIDRQPLDIGFLVSFVVDARGGAMKAKRRGGVRIIVPPAACSAPTRVTCRAATRRAPAAAPPPLMEGEALASRLLELQPQGAKFLAPVIIEVPIFTSSCREREIVILRSDTGETWQDHYLHNNDNPMIQEALQKERLEHGNSGETLGESGERVTRIITCDFPHYLAVVSRVRQEVHIIGPEGGTVSSAHIPQVQALFPPSALTKRIRVGLQAHGASQDLCRRILPRHAAVSPVITVEPRRRKFHRSITLTAPLPAQGAGQEKSTANLRLLCSIMGGQARAVWEDVTGSTPLTVTDDCASFTTTVSARFWLMNCQNVSDATKLATELYRDMLLVPFEVRIVVLGKRLDALEGRLLVLYITDRYAYDTLLQQEHYTEVAHSTSVRFLDGKQVFLEFSGNLVPVTKSGSQPMFTFEAFKDNRVEFTVRVKHHEETPSGRIYFMNEPKVPRGEQSQTPACVLDVALPERIAPRAGKSQLDCLNLDQSGFDALKDELSFHWGEHNNSLGPGSLPYQNDIQVNGHDKIITNGDVKYPTKDSDDKDTKPQVNGDSLHVDSNKTKATFDSDEDKTPMNTLEKGDKDKKKPEGGSFLGGLAGKVKNVFSHSDDKDDEKESSPKPQPKPRESKDKSPPKPAPRIIDEDLLTKVDDMFKDLKTKPHQKDEEELQSQVYSTKLVVDEDEHKPTKEIEEHIYEQYANMQPVETPLYNKISDPFQYPNNKCCEKKYKHSHEETSNLEDIIEHTKFTAHEKLGEIGDKVQNDVKDGLSKIEEGKEDIKQKGGEIKEGIIEKVDKVKGDLKDKEQKLESQVHDKLDDVNKSVHKVQGDINAKVSDIKSSSKAGVDHLVHTAHGVTVDVNDKAHLMDFAARERAEQLKEFGHDKLVTFGDSLENATDDFKTKAKGVGNDLKNKAQDGAEAFADSFHKAQDNLGHKAHDVKEGVKETENIKDATNEKIHDLNESIDNAKTKAGNVAADLKSKAEDTKDNVKSEVKKKSKKGKNFFTGLVDNIFGEKDKIEDEVKGKIAESKETADNLLEQASAKKNEIEHGVAKKKDELKESAEKLTKDTEAKKDEVEKAIHSKTAEVKTAVQDKASNVKSAVEDKAHEVKSAAEDKAHEVKFAVEDKAHEVESAVEDKAHEVKSAVCDAKSSVENKAEELKSATQTKAEETSKAVHDKKEEVVNAAQSKKDEISTAIHDKAGEVKESLAEAKDAIHNKKDELANAVHNKVNDAKNTKDEVLETIQSKTEELGQAMHNKKEEIGNALSHKKDEWESVAFDKTNEAVSAVQGKKDEVSAAIQGKKDEAASDLERIRQEAEQTTEQIKKSAEDALNKGKDNYGNIQKAASDKANDLQKSSKQAFDHVQDTTLSTFDKVESSAKDKVSDAKDTWEDLQSSTRDTFADFKDDVHGLESSAQDTLHSFQSSAGNTFDSLDDSAKEMFGGVQNAASNAETSSKEFFGDVKGEFEGFQVSADNKLEDVKGETKERLAEAGERLSEAGRGAADTVNAAENNVADAVSSEADKFTSSLNDLGNSVFGSSGKGFMKDSSAKLLESEKSQSSPSPHKKSSGIPKLKKKNKK